MRAKTHAFLRVRARGFRVAELQERRRAIGMVDGDVFVISRGDFNRLPERVRGVTPLARFVQIAPAFLRASRGGDARGAVRHLEKRAAASEASTLARARRAGRRAARAMRIPYNRLQRI